MTTSPSTPAPLRHPAMLPDDFDSYRDFYLWEDADVDKVVAGAFAFKATTVAEPVDDPAMIFFLQGLYSAIHKHHANEVEFTVAYNGCLFRGHRDVTLTKPLLALRRMPSQAPLLTDLAMPSIWRDILMWQELCKGGLIVLAAVMGQGKSTTTAAIIRSRLEQYGGFCRTIEDPCELPLHGRHGDGICIQTPVNPAHGRAGFSEALRSSLRSYPTIPGSSMCLVGEVRDSETAADLIRAAVNGTLVITTIHASAVQTAISRLLALAEHVMGEKSARDLLGSALRVVIHQKLKLRPDGEGWKRGEITGDLLFSKSETSTVATGIKNDGAEKLGEPIRQQSTLLNLPTPIRFSEFKEKVS